MKYLRHASKKNVLRASRQTSKFILLASSPRDHVLLDLWKAVVDVPRRLQRVAKICNAYR